IAVEVSKAEIVILTLLKLHRYERIPTESIIQRQLAVHFPCVRCIQRDKVLRKIFWIQIGLMEGRGVSGQEVDHRRTTNARKDEGTLGPCVRVSVEQGAHRDRKSTRLNS